MDGGRAAASKAELRQAMLAKRRAWPAPERERASEILCARLEQWTRSGWLPGRANPSIAVYLASPYEANLDELIRSLLRREIAVAAPRVDLKRNRISFWLLRSLEATETGAWGLREPPAWEPVESPALLLVPGVAFDSRGGRLGMGGGWYDRLLSGSVRSVGVAFDWQLVPDVPREAHDRPVDAVVTPGAWFAGGKAFDAGPGWSFAE